MPNKKKTIMSTARRRMYEADASTIAYWRRNPCIASLDLLGVELLDYQKYQLQSMWTASHVALCCGRDVGKSVIGSIFLTLWQLLFEDQEMYIISSVGEQAKQTFEKMESIITRTGKTASSFKDLKDIAQNEIVTSPTNKTGFSHNPTGHTCKSWNGSKTRTLNSKPDNIRGKRANVVFFDEAAFCDDELLIIGEAFTLQSSDFVTSTNTDYDPELDPLKPPAKLIYASSQDSMTTLFYKYYKSFAKKMLAGDRDYFVCDMTCEVAMNTYMYGKPYLPLLTRDKVQQALNENRSKALREYYNQPQADSGTSGICRLGTIRKNETFDLPALNWEPGYRYVIAFDPARTGDNSIIGVMRMYEDDKYGYIGELCNMISLVDENSTSHYKLDSNRQIEQLRKVFEAYSGPTSADYEYIDAVMIDAGAGGGGVSTYGDTLLNDWTDSKGIDHAGLIDLSYELYANYEERYPNAIDKLRMISPKKYRTQMVEEFIDLINMGCIRFPRECHGDTVTMITGTDKNGDDIMETRDLTDEEILALRNIDLAKTEIVSIQKTENAEHTTVQYALSKDKALTNHDDRFYVTILLSHYLYQRRKRKALKEPKQDEDDLLLAPICVSAIAM